MKLRGFTCLMIATGCMVFSAPALSDVLDTCPVAPDDPDAARDLAGAWFSRALQHTQHEKYDQAVKAFQCSLEMVEHPATVLNLAHAARKAEKIELACHMYRKYVPLATNPDKARLASDSLVELSCETLSAPVPVDPSTPVTGPEQPKPVDTSITPKETSDADSTDSSLPHEASMRRGIGMTLSAIGGVGVLTGALFHIFSYANQQKGLSTSDQSAFLEYQHHAEAFRVGAVIGYTVGGGFLLAGVSILAIHAKSTRTDVSFPKRGVRVVPSGRGILLVGSF